MRVFVPYVVAIVMAAPVALADPERPRGSEPPGHVFAGRDDAGRGDRKGEWRGEGKYDRGERDEKRDGAAGERGERPGDDDDDDLTSDGGKAAGKRSAAQGAFRREVWDRRERVVDARVHRGGKRLTPEERTAIQEHWLQVSRLMRIRELAQEDKDDATVKRADAALAREEKRSEAKLDALNGAAPGGDR